MALTRDPDSINIFKDAAVYVANTSTPTIPATVSTAFGSTWDNLGVLDGDAGIPNAREWAETEHFGWGIGLYRIGRKNYKESRTVTALEANVVTQLIAHGSTSTSTGIYVNRGVRKYLGFEYTNDFGNVERAFTTMPADLWLPNIDRNESDPSKQVITVRIFADGAGKLYTRQFTGINQTITIGGSPTGGTFSLTYQGQTASGITYNATNTAVDSALEGLSTIGTAGVVVTGASPTYSVAGLEYLLSATSALTPSGTVTIARV